MSESHPPESANSSTVSPEQAREISKHITSYLKVSCLQITFALAMVGISFINFPSNAMQIFVTLLVTTINATLVASILMHLKEEKRMIWKFLIFTGVFFFVLFFLTYLARTDMIFGTSHTHH